MDIAQENALLRTALELADTTLRKESAYTMEMLDPASSPDSRCDAAREKNEAHAAYRAAKAAAGI